MCSLLHRHLRHRFRKNTGYNSVSTFVVAKMVINNQITRGTNFRLKPAAGALLNGVQTTLFERAFGDCFVRGKFTGGEFYAVMRLTSLDTSTQSDLAISLKLDIEGVVAGGSFKGKFQTASQDTKSRAEFSASFFQRGGSGEAEIGSTLSVDEIKARLHNFPTAVANHAFPYEVEVVRYDTVPIPVQTKEQQDDFLLALADADQKKLKFLQIRNDLEFAAEHSEFFDSPPPPAALLADAELFLQAANGAIAHAVKLSRGEINPPQLFDPAKATPPITLPALPALRKSPGFTTVPSVLGMSARADQNGPGADEILGAAGLKMVGVPIPSDGSHQDLVLLQDPKASDTPVLKGSVVTCSIGVFDG